MSKDKPAKWWAVHRNDEEKCVFVGKDGESGLIRAKDKHGKHYDWRSTDALARESGLSKKRTEEILDHWCKKGVVRQHAKDPEKWGYWENVGQEKQDPDPVAKDHEDRVDKQMGKPVKTQVPTPTQVPVGAPPSIPAPPTKLPRTLPKMPTRLPTGKAPAPVAANP